MHSSCDSKFPTATDQALAHSQTDPLFDGPRSLSMFCVWTFHDIPLCIPLRHSTFQEEDDFLVRVDDRCVHADSLSLSCIVEPPVDGWLSSLY